MHIRLAKNENKTLEAILRQTEINMDKNKKGPREKDVNNRRRHDCRKKKESKEKH